MVWLVAAGEEDEVEWARSSVARGEAEKPVAMEIELDRSKEKGFYFEVTAKP